MTKLVFKSHSRKTLLQTSFNVYEWTKQWRMNNLEELKHAGAAFRLNGLVSCLETGNVSFEEEKEIRNLTKDNVLLAGRPLHAYAYAVLDLLGVEK